MRLQSDPGFNDSGLRALHAARMTAAMPRSCGRTLSSNALAMRIRRSPLHPTPDPRYVFEVRNSHWKIMRSIDNRVAPAEVVANYNRMFRGTPLTEVNEGIIGLGLFVKDPVRRMRILIEYTLGTGFAALTSTVRRQRWTTLEFFRNR